MAAPTADMIVSFCYLLCFVKTMYFSVTYCKPGGCGFRQSVQLQRREATVASDRFRDSGIPPAVNPASDPAEQNGRKHRKHKDFPGSDGWHGILLISQKYG
jgi:hypothetical protein